MKFWTLALVGVSLAAQSVPKEQYDFAYIGQRLSDPMLQKAKETYVVLGCAYCHGLNLVPRGEAPDLKRSKVISQDTDGKMIISLLRAGIPQTPALSPMPSFSDLSDQQFADLARWIHYARAEGHLKELTELREPPAGNAGAGDGYFKQNCASCHSAGDLAGIAQRLQSPALTMAFLKPKLVGEMRSWKVDQLRDTKKIEARQRHQHLLENYTAEEVSNLTSYLASLK